HSLFLRPLHHPHLHSFPTRRSSDLNSRSAKATSADSLTSSSESASLEINPSRALSSPIDPSATADSCLTNTLTSCDIACSNAGTDRKSTRLNSSHDQISYAVFCLKK